MKLVIFGCTLVMAGSFAVMWPELKGLRVNERLSNIYRATGFGLLFLGVGALLSHL